MRTLVFGLRHPGGGYLALNMALTLHTTQTDYRVAKFAAANVFVFRSSDGVGYVGVRHSVAVALPHQANANGDRIRVLVEIWRSQVFVPLGTPHPIPAWAGWFAPGAPVQDFFPKYDWFEYKNIVQAETALLALIP